MEISNTNFHVMISWQRNICSKGPVFAVEHRPLGKLSVENRDKHRTGLEGGRFATLKANLRFASNQRKCWTAGEWMDLSQPSFSPVGWRKMTTAGGSEGKVRTGSVHFTAVLEAERVGRARKHMGVCQCSDSCREDSRD